MCVLVCVPVSLVSVSVCGDLSVITYCVVVTIFVL